MKECPLCAAKMPSHLFPKLKGCQHRSCRTCLRQVSIFLIVFYPNDSSMWNSLSLRTVWKSHAQNVPPIFIQMTSSELPLISLLILWFSGFWLVICLLWWKSTRRSASGVTWWLKLMHVGVQHRIVGEYTENFVSIHRNGKSYRSR